MFHRVDHKKALYESLRGLDTESTKGTVGCKLFFFTILLFWLTWWILLIFQDRVTPSQIRTIRSVHVTSDVHLRHLASAPFLARVDSEKRSTDSMVWSEGASFDIVHVLLTKLVTFIDPTLWLQENRQSCWIDLTFLRSSGESANFLHVRLLFVPKINSFLDQ